MEGMTNGNKNKKIKKNMPIIVQKDATFYSFYSLQTAPHISADTFTHHQERE
jgi:hypothetical protein